MASKLFFVALLFFITPFGMKIVYADLTPKEILARSQEAGSSPEGFIFKIHISSVENYVKHDRVLEVKAKGPNFLATILSPLEEKGQKALRVNRTLWFIKPGLSAPYPISPRELLTRGVTYGDIATVDYANEYEASLLPEQVIGNELCYVFDLKTKNPHAMYPQLKHWISKKRLLGVKTEFFLVSGKMLKSATFEHKNVVLIRDQKYPFPSTMVVTEVLMSQNVSTLTFSEPTLLKIPDSTFDVNLLKLD